MKFTWENCPYCHKTINFKSEGGAGWIDSPVGKPRSLTCRNCGKAISDGKQEWVDLDFLDRAVYILRTIWSIFAIGCIGGIVVSQIVLAAIGSGNEPMFSAKTFVIWIIWVCLITVVWTRDVWLNISESNQRVANSLRLRRMRVRASGN